MAVGRRQKADQMAAKVGKNGAPGESGAPGAAAAVVADPAAPAVKRAAKAKAPKAPEPNYLPPGGCAPPDLAPQGAGHKRPVHHEYTVRALVLQGGGALGSYQAGVYQLSLIHI